MELIVLNVGLDVKVLNTKIFTIFVLMALFTTFITTPVLHFLYIRKLPKLTEEQAPSDEFSVLAPIRLPKLASGVMHGICVHNTVKLML